MMMMMSMSAHDTITIKQLEAVAHQAVLGGGRLAGYFGQYFGFTTGPEIMPRCERELVT